MGEFMEQSRIAAFKNVAIAIAAIFLIAGVVYTGIHNFNLYQRALPAGQEVFALIPVILIEGGIMLFLGASFVWFSGGAQKIVAMSAGWGLFVIAAFNTVVDSTSNRGGVMPDWLQTYATYGVFAIPVVIMAVLKLIFDLDPAKRKLDMQKAIEHALFEAKFAAAKRALLSETNRAALEHYSQAFGGMIANHIRESAPPQIPAQIVDGTARPQQPAPAQTPEAEPTPAPAMGFAKDADAGAEVQASSAKRAD